MKHAGSSPSTAPAVGAENASPFNPFTILILVVVGVLGLVALVTLNAYAPDLSEGEHGGAHALSNSAIGFSGLVRLVDATGGHPWIVRDPLFFHTPDLLVVTPENRSVDISTALQRGNRSTLIILPKWATVADPRHTGWVRSTGLLPISEPVGVTAPGWNFRMDRRQTGGNTLLTNDDSLPDSIRLRAPAQLQVITKVDPPSNGAEIAYKPLLTDDQGGVVLIELGARPLYILTDPDILNNQGMGDEAQAASALALLHWLNGAYGKSIAFDVSYNGLGGQRSPLRLLFEPPFAAGTACLTVALLLAGISAFARFGPARPAPRAITFGKAALVNNAALMVRKAGKEARMGALYARVLRQQIKTGGPADHPALGRFAELSTSADTAKDRATLLSAAQALHDWKKEITG